MSLEHDLRSELETLRESGLFRELTVFDGPAAGAVRLSTGGLVLPLCSNDYLGLANDDRLKSAMTRAVEDWGAGAGASRLISGTARIHRTAEMALASFVGLPAALLFGSGYAANVGLLQALCSSSDLVVSDALNHASIIDGCRLSGARIAVFRHADVDEARRVVRDQRKDARRVVIVSESVFSMDGDIAPIRELRSLADEYDAGLVIDEAHALGVAGARGTGICQELRVTPDVLVGTLGKAFGAFGAFVAGSEGLISFLENKARTFMFATALPPAYAAAALCATKVVQEAEDRRELLRRHTARLRKALCAMALDVRGDDRTPIIPIVVGGASSALAFSKRLMELGVFVPAVRPPTVPDGTSRLRLVANAGLTEEQVETALDAFARL